MFSEEKRRKAVEHFVQFDLKAKATVRALGYPSSKTLRRWYRESQLKELRPGDKKRKSRFSEEAQIVAVNYYLEHGRCGASTIRALGYPGPDTLRKWLRAYDRSLIHEVPASKEPFPDTVKKGAVIALGMGEDSVALPDAANRPRADMKRLEVQLLAHFEAAMGGILEAVVHAGFLQFSRNPIGVRYLGSPDFVQKAFGAEGLVVHADLVKLLPAVAHELAGLGNVLQVGGQLQEAEFPPGGLLGYSGVGGHSFLRWWDI